MAQKSGWGSTVVNQDLASKVLTPARNSLSRPVFRQQTVAAAHDLTCLSWPGLIL